MAATAQGQEERPSEAAIPQIQLEPPTPPNSVDENLADAETRPAGIFKYGPVSLIDPVWKQLDAQTKAFGLQIGLAATSVYQVASNGPGVRDAAGYDIDFFGNWRLLTSNDGLNNGYLYFATEYRQELFTDIAPAALGGQIGSLWGTTNGFGEQNFTIKEMYWQQHFGGDHLIIRVGKVDPENYYNSNYWQSDNKYFLNKAFSSFPVRSFPGQGLGINVTSKLSDKWYISTGFQDAEGQKSTAGFNTFFQDFNLFSAFEVGYTPTIPGLGVGAYRFTAWYRAAGERNGQPHDAGFDISFDQHISEHLIPFFRAGIGEGNINGIDDMIDAGIGWEGPLLTPNDAVAFAASWGKPSNHKLNDQFALETFYRLQVSPDNQFTLGYQVIFDPSNAPTSGTVGVFEMRWRIAF